jgi:hypothetical protein
MTGLQSLYVMKTVKIITQKYCCALWTMIWSLSIDRSIRGGRTVSPRAFSYRHAISETHRVRSLFRRPRQPVIRISQDTYRRTTDTHLHSMRYAYHYYCLPVHDHCSESGPLYYTRRQTAHRSPVLRSLSHTHTYIFIQETKTSALIAIIIYTLRVDGW